MKEARAAYATFTIPARTGPEPARWTMASWGALPPGTKSLWCEVVRVSGGTVGSRLETLTKRLGVIRLVVVGEGRWGAQVGGKSYQADSLLALCAVLEGT